MLPFFCLLLPPASCVLCALGSEPLLNVINVDALLLKFACLPEKRPFEIILWHFIIPRHCRRGWPHTLDKGRHLFDEKRVGFVWLFERRDQRRPQVLPGGRSAGFRPPSMTRKASSVIALRFWEYPGIDRMMATNAFFEHLGLAGAFIIVAAIDLTMPSSHH
ncbi:hypothetical protein [Rhizobium leguminosarum]|uniref:hypothetical protein n=1 Tax=Rhizobium leguminosarum TaxID=384 RepID=UPI001FE2257D